MDLESALTFHGHLAIFSGSRGAAKALANRTGRWVLCYDLKHSDRENFLSSEIQTETEELIASDVFLTLTAGPVCATFFAGRLFGRL